MVLGSTGNVGIGTTSPVYALDVNGTIDSTSLTTGAVYSTNITSTNIVGTNISAGTLALSNINVSTATIANLKSTNISTNSIIIDNNNNSNGIQIGVGTGNTTSNLNLYGSFTDGYAIIQAGSTNNNSPNLKIVRMTTVNGTIANFHVYSQTSSFIGGNVGIGTTTPGSVLDIVSSTPLITLRNSSGGDGKIYFGNGSHGVGRNASIGTLTHGNDVTLWTNGGGASIGFATSLTERMRITDVGNVGIGITSPTEKLHVVGNIKSTGSIDTDIQFLGQASDSATGPSFSWTGDTNTGFYRPLADTLGFVTNGTDRVRIDSAGNVGIGTNSPGQKLDVNGTTLNRSGNAVGAFSENQQLFGWSGSTTGAYMHAIKTRHNGGANDIHNALDFYVWQTSDAVTSVGTKHVMSATSVGVGIGTTSPAYTLQVNGDIALSYGNVIRVHGHTYSKAIEFIWQNNQDQLVFYTPGANNGNAKLCIQQDGNVGIGSTAPAAKLHTVLGDATGGGNPGGWDSTYSVFGQTGNNGGAVGIGYNSASGGSITSLSPGVAWRTMRYRANEHRFIVQDASPSLTIGTSGNVGIGTTAPLEALHVNGQIFLTTGASLWITGRTDNDPKRFRLHNNAGPTYMDFNGGDIIFRSGVPPTTRATLTTGGTLWTNYVGINGAASAKQFASGYQGGGAATGNTSFGITFGYTPNVVASIVQNDNTSVFGVQITSVSTTGFSYRKTFYRFNGGYGGDAVSEGFYWIAM